ncbi:MAG: Glycosyl hydrolase, BNR repeat precursor, partial [uncultured Gemmatimonadetes bacterium]
PAAPDERRAGAGVHPAGGAHGCGGADGNAALPPGSGHAGRGPRRHRLLLAGAAGAPGDAGLPGPAGAGDPLVQPRHAVGFGAQGRRGGRRERGRRAAALAAVRAQPGGDEPLHVEPSLSRAHLVPGDDPVGGGHGDRAAGGARQLHRAADGGRPRAAPGLRGAHGPAPARRVDGGPAAPLRLRHADPQPGERGERRRAADPRRAPAGAGPPGPHAGRGGEDGGRGPAGAHGRDRGAAVPGAQPEQPGPAELPDQAEQQAGGADEPRRRGRRRAHGAVVRGVHGALGAAGPRAVGAEPGVGAGPGGVQPPAARPAAAAGDPHAAARGRGCRGDAAGWRGRGRGGRGSTALV